MSNLIEQFLSVVEKLNHDTIKLSKQKKTGEGFVHDVTLSNQLAAKKKFKLYIVFVDFAQAYDKVSRVMLFTILKRLGCGASMILALIAMYKATQSVYRYCYSYYKYRCTSKVPNLMSVICNLC